MLGRQFPLKYEYGVARKKTKGQSSDMVGEDLLSDVFSHRQLYVALGRSRRAEDIKVLLPEERLLDDYPQPAVIILEDFIRG